MAQGAPADPLPRLLDAQEKAWRLLAEAEGRGMIAAGQSEAQLSRRLHALARGMFGVRRHWHKRIVRAGPNTLRPYREEPPNLPIGSDSILFVDLGPVFEEWEADIGMTFVLGDDPWKHRLAADAVAVWHEAKAWFDAHPSATGHELHARVLDGAQRRGWALGGAHCGHLIGRFPHERIHAGHAASYIHPGNAHALRGVAAGAGSPDGARLPRHWVLEVHLVDRARGHGAFFEQLLTGPADAAQPRPPARTRQSKLGPAP